jgi:hypothetical protein
MYRALKKQAAARDAEEIATKAFAEAKVAKENESL